MNDEHIRILYSVKMICVVVYLLYCLNFIEIALAVHVWISGGQPLTFTDSHQETQVVQDQNGQAREK